MKVLAKEIFDTDYPFSSLVLPAAILTPFNAISPKQI